MTIATASRNHTMYTITVAPIYSRDGSLDTAAMITLVRKWIGMDAVFTIVH